MVTGLGAVAAMVFNPLAGYFSDRWVTQDNRSMVVALGLVTGGASLWLLGLQHSVAGLAIVCAFALGAGYGAFQSVSQALSMTVLPDQASAARDLGIINVATAIPQVIGPPLAAVTTFTRVRS